MKTNFEVLQTTQNGWQQIAATFMVEVRPRWWEFWKREIPKQKFTASMWVKSSESLAVMNPNLETFNTKEK